MGTRYNKDIEKELKLKYNIVWLQPFGYVWKSSITKEISKTCTATEVEKAVDKIVDDRLRSFGVAPERL